MARVQNLFIYLLVSTSTVFAEVYVLERVGTAAVDLLPTQGKYLYIYPSVAINVTGEVMAWEFHAKETGIVLLSLWDVIGENKFRLHDKTKIVVAELGRQVFLLSEEDRYQAHANQTFGVHSEDANGGGIIPIARDNCCNMKTRPVHRRGVYNSGLPLGQIEEGVNVNYDRALAVLVHLKTTVAPAVTMTGPGPMVSSEKTNPLVCYDVPSSPPGMLSYHLDCGAPIISAVVNVTITGGSCEAVLVFGTVRSEGQEKVHRRCPSTYQEGGDVMLCSYACTYDPEAEGHVTTVINLRIHHQMASQMKLCSIEI